MTTDILMISGTQWWRKWT